MYNNAAQYSFDDRTLAHLKIAITSKLRLQEGFLLSWRVPLDQGSGRVSIWLSPAIPIQFLFQQPEPRALNRKWLEALARYSHGSRGMIVMSEDEAEAIATDDPMDARAYAEVQKAFDAVTARLPQGRG
ncbi:hypothetical protein ACO2Q7_03550 [Rathayibacter sp. KR2-224]|uniref:DUF7882 family protein n=1 Tax=Rathayibacter sp. KR2-224 TaxID=3400913 RepID=UPI003BFFFBA6